MEFYTNSISERTRLKRAIYEDAINQRKRTKPSAGGLTKVNEHSPRKDFGQGSQGVSSSTKRASGKGRKKVCSSSNDVKDVKEFSRKERPAKATHITGMGGCGSGRKLSGQGSKRVSDSRRQLHQADEVECFSADELEEEEPEANGIDDDSDVDVQEVDESEFMRLASRSKRNAASSSKQNTPHSLASNGDDVENFSFSVGSEQCRDVEGTDDTEDMVGSSDDFDELSSSSESESDDSEDEDYEVEKDSPSITMVWTSSDSEEVDEEESVELILDKELCDDSEDEGEIVDTQDLKRNEAVIPMKQKRRIETAGMPDFHDKPTKKNSKSESHVARDKSSNGESSNKHALERNECLGRNGEKLFVSSLWTYEEEASSNSDFNGNSTKLKDKTVNAHSLRTKSSQEGENSVALNRKEGLGRKSEKRLNSSSQTYEKEASRNSVDMYKIRSFGDLDADSTKLKAKTSKSSPAFSNICESRATRDCSLQTEKVVQPVNTEDGEEKDESPGLTKRKRYSEPKDKVLDALLKDLLEEGKTDEAEDLADDQEAKPPSPVKESIPLKFRFEDEDEYPQEKEKSDFDLMVEGLFDEMYYAQQLGSSGTPAAEIEEKDDGAEGVNCSNGNHGEQYFDEQIGLRCSCCNDIILESKYVLPDLVTPTSEKSRTRNSWREREFLKFDGLALDASRDIFRDSCNYSSGTVWDTVPGVQEQMYPHQQEGFEFLWTNLAGTISLPKLISSDLSGGGGCIISHAPGTGKTKLTIIFLEAFLNLFPNCRPIIIAPVSILLTWEEEFKKWKTKFPFHNLNDLAVSSDKNVYNNKDLVRVMKMHAWKKGRSVLGVSYNLFEKLAGEKFIKEKGKKKREKVAVGKNLEMLRSILLEMPRLVVLDEGHTARNERSGIWNSLTNLKTKKCIILSGTPFQNNFRELFNTLSLVRPEIAAELAKERTFAEGIRPRVGKRVNRQGFSLTSQKLDEAIGKLKATIAPFVHVHKGIILQKSLLGLRDCVVILSPAPLQKNLIKAIENLRRQNTFEFEHKVAMVSVHPSLILHCGNLSQKERSSFDQAELEKLRTDYDPGVKTRFVVELIRLSVALDEKVLIFSQYVQPLELIMDQIKAVFDWSDGKQVYCIRGKLDQKQRQKMINAYNDPNSKAKVMLASIKCCSEGIHLIGASRIVLLDVVWNPSVERQAICRAYRLGQKKVVYTYHLMTSGTTEAEKYCRQSQKDRISELVFSAPSSVTTEDPRNEKQKDPVVHLDDKVLEDMVGHTRLKDMFNKIIYQPKDTNLIESFGSESF